MADGDEHAHVGDITAKLPSAFIDWLRSNNIDPSVYRLAATLPRSIRSERRSVPSLTPHPRRRVSGDVSLPQLAEAFGPSVKPVSWLPGFYTLDASVAIAGSELYKTGRIAGVDVSSGAAAQVLHVQPTDHVLDLCCAPGAKLTMLASCLGACFSILLLIQIVR